MANWAAQGWHTWGEAMMIPCLGSSRVWLILAHRFLLSHMHNWVLLADCCFSQQACEGGSPWALGSPFFPFPSLLALQWLCHCVPPLLPTHPSTEEQGHTDASLTSRASLGHRLVSAYLNEMEMLFLLCALQNGEETWGALCLGTQWALSSWSWRFPVVYI